MDDEPASIGNDAFFRAPAALEWPPRQHTVPSIPDITFYGNAHEPVEEVPFTVRFPSNPLGWGALLFLLGWIGIAAQRGFFRQLVVGAPVFEEFAKFGLALVVVTAFGLRSVWLRLPFAWLSGAAFGVLEHFLTYADEPLWGIVDRTFFHACACGLSMAVYTLVEPLPDVRARWVSTIPSSLFHWANNLGALAFGVVGLLLRSADAIDLAWSIIVTAGAFVLSLVVAIAAPRLRPRVERELRAVFPPLHLKQAEGATPAAPPAEGPGER